MRRRDWLTANEAAREIPLPVSPDLLTRLARQGRIPASRIGRRWFFTHPAIEQAKVLVAGHIKGTRW